MVEDIFMEGGSTAVLMFHSLTNTPFTMYYLANTLYKEGYTVYAPCFSGHQHERILDTLKASVSDWIQDGIKALDFLAENDYDKIIVIGESLGGVVAIKLLIDYPKVDRGIILSTPSFAEWHHQGIYDEVKDRVYKNARKGLVPNEDKEIQAAHSKLKRILTDLNKTINELTEAHSQIQQPVLIGHADEDSIVPVSLAKRLNQSIPRSQINYYETDEHLLSSSKLNSDLAEDIISFIT